jgi:hypothetical protein
MSHAYLWRAGKLFPSGGNECALINDRFAPCQMVMNDLRPFWPACPLNAQAGLPAPDRRTLEAGAASKTET